MRYLYQGKIMLQRKEKLARLVQFGVEISQIADLDLLLEKILGEARYLINSDAGSIYVKEGDELNFSCAQNETFQQKLEPGKKLIYTTFKLPINNNSIAGFVANNGSILNIPDAYEISAALSFSFDSSYDKKAGYHTQSMLTVPMKSSRSDIIGVIQLINARDEKNKIIPFKEEDEPLVQHLAVYAANAIERAQMTRTTLMRMISMAELRDPKETGAHVNRVASYAVEIFEAYAKQKNMPQVKIDAQRDKLRLAAMLHDVGKVAISDVILKKPGRFTDEEYEIMKEHTWLGARLFSGSRTEFDEYSEEVVMNHHERWDGNGYPGWINMESGEPLPDYLTDNGNARGKKGDEIPLFGRIVSLADVFDALSSKRVYKDAWDEDKVLDMIRSEKEKQFDPELVDIFFDILDLIRAISQRYPDED